MIVIGITGQDAGNVVAFNSRPSDPEANILAEKFVAVLNIVLSYAGHVAFPSKSNRTVSMVQSQSPR